MLFRVMTVGHKAITQLPSPMPCCSYQMVDHVPTPTQQFKQHWPRQSLRGATGGVETVSPDFLVMDSLLSMPPTDALLPSDPS